MSQETVPSISTWKLAALPAVAMLLLALYPQINMWLARGTSWQGSYVSVQGDEDAYSAYINALIDGRPRRNDPHSGRDDAPGSPQPESLFSIQFLPAYAIAWPARLLHLSASTSFILLMAIAAIAAAAAVFWLITSVTEDRRLASAGVLFVLCLGTLVATQGSIRAFLGTAPTYNFFPFLRRYQPAFPFPFFFVFCVFVWRALNASAQRAAIGWSVSAGLIVAGLVFSYFYLWTAAIAWLAGCSLIWFVGRREAWRRTLLVSGSIFGLAGLALIPYFRLLSHRDPNMDKIQLLTLTHAPDLFRVAEILGFVALAALIVGARRGLIADSRAALFTASFAFLPFVVFNQQIITGRSMQPLHYELFIANYVGLLSLVMTAAVLFHSREKQIPGRAIALLGLLSLGWGFIEATDATKSDVARARMREDAMPIARKLAELTQTNSNATASDPRPVVFCSTLPVADFLPTVMPGASLWALHMDAFPGAGIAERKERFYQYMYYSGISDKELEKAILEGRFAIMVALFGVERIIPGLVADERPLTREDMQREWLGYTQYVASFSRERAAHPTLSYIVVPTDVPPDLSNLDKWYERGPGQTAGLFTIYPVKLRP